MRSKPADEETGSCSTENRMAARLTLAVSLLVLVALLECIVKADPTWPSPRDGLEEIMYLLKAFNGRRFCYLSVPAP